MAPSTSLSWEADGNAEATGGQPPDLKPGCSPAAPTPVAGPIADSLRGGRAGFTHIELSADAPSIPLWNGSWAIRWPAFYAPTSRFGSPDEFPGLR